jgi:hypothetical protein
MTLLPKAADEIRTAIILNLLKVQKTYEAIETSKYIKKNNFVGLVTSGLWPEVSRGPPVGPIWFTSV